MSEFMKIQDCQLTEITTVPIWVPFRVPGPPGPLGDLFVNLGPLIGLFFCLKVPFFSILGKGSKTQVTEKFR